MSSEIQCLSFFSLLLFISYSAALCSLFMLFSSNAHYSSCLSPLPSISLFLYFFILHGSSPVIHPCQATIPYKASGSPHLASYFHIRSAVTDRVYTGSSLECKPASLAAVPQTLSPTPHHPSLLLFLQLHLLLLLLHFFLPTHSSSSHLSPFLRSHLSVSSISSHLNTKHRLKHSILIWLLTFSSQQLQPDKTKPHLRARQEEEAVKPYNTTQSPSTVLVYITFQSPLSFVIITSLCLSFSSFPSLLSLLSLFLITI